MLKLPFVLIYTAMTFLAWGVYGILLNYGQGAMGRAYFKPFVGVGFAYFVIAVLGAGALLGGKQEKGHWSFLGTVYSLIAGSVGALGALGVILALAFGGEPVYVMPLVFGGAPVINTLFTSWLNKTFKQISPLFVIGMVLVGIGMIGVLQYKPHGGGKHAEPSKPATTESARNAMQLSYAMADVTGTSSESSSTLTSEAGTTSTPEVQAKKPSFFYIFLSIVLAVFCWGTYGPVLHLGQMRMGGSRLRPFICVGLAYFVIAVAMPLSLLPLDTSGSFWSWPGMLWSIAAGTAGAIGALGIILAFNSGGKPIFVMPLVFGFAPVVNTLSSLWIANQLHTIDPVFAASLATTICGAVMVLIFAPKAKHGPPSKSEAKEDSHATPAVASEPEAPLVPSVPPSEAHWAPASTTVSNQTDSDVKPGTDTLPGAPS